VTVHLQPRTSMAAVTAPRNSRPNAPSITRWS
jgi:hypothetical protein